MMSRTLIRLSCSLRSGLAVGVPLCALAGQTQADLPDRQLKAGSQLLKLARTPGGRAR